MHKSRYSYIAHGHLPLWNPVGVTHLQRYVRQLALPEESLTLDIGCGIGLALNLILSQYNTSAIGVDSSSYAIRQAARDLAPLISAGRLTLLEQGFEALDYGASSFRLIICIGSTHAAGGYRETLRDAKRLLDANGLLLVGEGYWKRPPAADYLSFLKMSENELSTHGGNQLRACAEGFDLVDCSECSQEEWDAYEHQYAQNVEDFVSANQHDPDAAAMLQRIRPWQDAYYRWGRDTLGFGLYLFRAGFHQDSPGTIHPPPPPP